MKTDKQTTIIHTIINNIKRTLESELLEARERASRHNLIQESVTYLEPLKGNQVEYRHKRLIETKIDQNASYKVENFEFGLHKHTSPHIVHSQDRTVSSLANI
jgi:hypothetical protein